MHETRKRGKLMRYAWTEDFGDGAEVRSGTLSDWLKAFVYAHYAAERGPSGDLWDGTGFHRVKVEWHESTENDYVPLTATVDLGSELDEAFSRIDGRA